MMFFLLYLYGLSTKNIINIITVSLILFLLLQLNLFKIEKLVAFFMLVCINCEIFIKFKYGDFSVGILESVLSTNKDEAYNFIYSNIGYVILLFIASLFQLFVLLRYNTKVKVKKLFFALIFFSVLIIRDCPSTVLFSNLKSKVDTNFFELNPQDSLINTLKDILNPGDNVLKFHNNYPVLIGDLFYTINFFAMQNRINELLRHFDSIKRDHGTVIYNKEKKSVKNIVLIMSESSSARYYNIYGYKTFKTTPYLNELHSEGRIAVCSKVHSPANITRTSVPLNLSFATPDDFNDMYTYKSIINLANEAGYKTFWLATQNSGGLTGYGNTYEFISRSSSEVVSPDIPNSKFFKVTEDDNLSLKLLEKAIRMGDSFEKKFIVLHWVGNHAPYNFRYDDRDKLDLPSASDYDRSIRKTDRLIYEVLKYMDRNTDEYLLLFTSDHGEIPFDEGAGVEHGLTYGGYGQYEIPFILANKGLNDTSCRDLDKYRFATGNFSGLYTKYVLLENMGFEINDLSKFVERDKVLHSDGRVYEYENIPTLSRK